MCTSRRLLSIFVALTLVVLAKQSDAALVDPFDGENGGVAALNYADFANFNVTAGSVDLIGNGNRDFYPGNGLYVDLNGSTGVSGTLESNTSFNPGTYELTFDIGRNPNGAGPTDSVMVGLGNYTETFERTGMVPLEAVTRTFTTDTLSPLVFSTLASDSDNGGIIIDNINLAPVPIPSSIWLFVSALLGIWTVTSWRDSKEQDLTHLHSQDL